MPRDNAPDIPLKGLHRFEPLELTLDFSFLDIENSLLLSLKDPLQQALIAMQRLEAGDLANPSEKRMVGHYWLRAPDLAPSVEIAQAIKKAQVDVKRFAQKIHRGKITDLLVVGIGGSVLGPQFLSDALGDFKKDKLRVHFLDNIDPEGLLRTLQKIEKLDKCLCLVMSKSGSTLEIQKVVLALKSIFKKAKVKFSSHAVAVTIAGSQLDQMAQTEKWVASFPVWDWVGGRTSVTSAIGLLPGFLQGLDMASFLKGAKACDEATRSSQILKNPAALLALSWWHAVKQKNKNNMVIVPYRDRLALFPRYLQQLVMESLGKAGEGLTVYGNKGSTDQHAYFQQLMEGRDDAFVVFLQVLQKTKNDVKVDGKTLGDYLQATLEGTRQALKERGRESLALVCDGGGAFNLGVLVALWERAVGLYAHLIHVNAYDQPGVEAGKKLTESAIKQL